MVQFHSIWLIQIYIHLIINKDNGGGEGEMYGKSNMETYITICKRDSQQKLALWLRKLKPRLCINTEGWDGVADGREVQKGGDI